MPGEGREVTLWDHICCLALGVRARFEGLSHLFRGHRLEWSRVNMGGLWVGCWGDMTCYSCPDTSDGESDLGIWCRNSVVLMRVMQSLCSILGHPEITEWKDGRTGEPNGHWHCARCVADTVAR